MRLVFAACAVVGCSDSGVAELLIEPQGPTRGGCDGPGLRLELELSTDLPRPGVYHELSGVLFVADEEGEDLLGDTLTWEVSGELSDVSVGSSDHALDDPTSARVIVRLDDPFHDCAGGQEPCTLTSTVEIVTPAAAIDWSIEGASMLFHDLGRSLPTRVVESEHSAIYDVTCL